MISDARIDDEAGSARQGFQAFADASSREGKPAVTYEVEDWRDDRGGAPETAAVPVRRRSWLGAGVLAGSVSLAAVAGVLLTRENPERTVEARTPVETQGPQMTVQVAQMSETMAPVAAAPGPKLEVLAPPVRTAALTIPPRAAPPSGSPSAPFIPRRSPVEPLLRAPAPLPGQDTTARAPPTRPPFNCADAPTLARAMVCSDRRLAALDQRMKQAYTAALAAGAPAELLNADQEDWLSLREDAAQDSPDAVASAYRQRIAELRQSSDF